MRLVNKEIYFNSDIWFIILRMGGVLGVLIERF